MKKSYSCSQIALLQSIVVILDSMQNLLAHFTGNNTLFDSKYVTAFRKRVNDAYKMIGISTQFDQKESTQQLVQFTSEVVNGLSNMRVIIEVCLSKDPQRCRLIISNLGLERFKKITNKSSKQLLTDIVNTYINTIPDYKTELVEKGANESKFAALETLIKQYIQAATSQHINKGQSAKLTAEQQDELNDLYDEIQAICKLGKNIFKDEPEKSALFNFSSIARRFTTQRQNKNNQPATTPKPVNNSSLANSLELPESAYEQIQMADAF